MDVRTDVMYPVGYIEEVKKAKIANVSRMIRYFLLYSTGYIKITTSTAIVFMIANVRQPQHQGILHTASRARYTHLAFQLQDESKLENTRMVSSWEQSSTLTLCTLKSSRSRIIMEKTWKRNQSTDSTIEKLYQ